MRAEETRLVQLGVGTVSSGTAVTGVSEVDYPQNAWLIVNAMVVGTSWAVSLSTGEASGSGLVAVAISGANIVSGTAAGVKLYHIRNKLSKWCYANVSGVGNSTTGVALLCQGYANSFSIPTAVGVAPVEA